MQRSLSEARDTDNSGTASWSACQQCLHHSRTIFVCQNTLVIHCSITSNNGQLPCLGHSSSRCFLMSTRVCLKPRERSHCIEQSVFSEMTISINFLFSRRAHLLQAFCRAVTSVPCQMACLLTVTLELCQHHFHTLWVFLLHKKPVGVCCYGDSQHLQTPISLGTTATAVLQQQLHFVGQFPHYFLLNGSTVYKPQENVKVIMRQVLYKCNEKTVYCPRAKCLN